ncbi:MAG: discoidin domain-containing protein [Candidatus Krumholzibacteriia bacterium]
MRRGLVVLALGGALLFAGGGCRSDRASAAAAPAITIDGFDAPGDIAAWTAHPADGVAMELSRGEGAAGAADGALRLDFRFTGGGWAVARRKLDVPLPADYVLRFRLRGDAPANHLELKLIDESGENVWWHVWRDLAWPAEWTTFRVRKRDVSFAWGPRGGGELERVAAIEFAVTAGSGGEGTVWIDALELVRREPVTGPPPEPVARASSAARGQPAAAALDGDGITPWAPAEDDDRPQLTLDLGRLRDLGGLTLDWAPDRHATDYVVEVLDEEGAWRTAQSVTGANGGRDRLYLPDTEATGLRLRLERWPGASPPALAEIALHPPEWSATREAFFTAVAADAARGLYPRSFTGEQIYWTVVGQDRDTREGLVSEDGAVEAGPGRFSVEPFLTVSAGGVAAGGSDSGRAAGVGGLVTWADVEIEHALVDGSLPMPRVTWRSHHWWMETTVFAVGEPGASSLVVRYRLAMRRHRPWPVSMEPQATLHLAVRPFQVNPPTQTLNRAGGTAPIHSIAHADGAVLVNGAPALVPLAEPDAFAASTFAGGDAVADHLGRGEPLPDATAVDDPFGAASALLSYRLADALRDTLEVAIVLPLHAGASVPRGVPVAQLQAAAAEEWRRRLAPAEAALAGVPWGADGGAGDGHGDVLSRDELVATLKAQLGYILVNRAGPAIQPGARSYARSWIRDGALTGAALLDLGHAESVRDFLEWYAPHQYASGKIPCVVDARGADPVPEHDSTGEFIHLVAAYHRATGDRDLLQRMWPRVVAGISYLESLLEERRTAAYQAPELRHFYGILPPSISHEGYSAAPMHSYWDDFWALRGYRDAVWLAGEMVRLTEGVAHAGQAHALRAEEHRLAAVRDRFAADLGASVAAAMAHHGIDYVPGCADLGDFDPTSTTIALTVVDARDVLPPGALERTFERYWEFFLRRRDGDERWDVYTPYELRNVGAFARLGWTDRARELLAFFMDHRRPEGWRQWAEVVGREERQSRFLGDMPHTWVGSDYIRAVLELWAAEAR